MYAYTDMPKVDQSWENKSGENKDLTLLYNNDKNWRNRITE